MGPLQALAHEMAHRCRQLKGADKDKDGKLKSEIHIEGGENNREERETINQWENPIAKEMKEKGVKGWNERTNHSDAAWVDGRYGWDGVGQRGLDSKDIDNLLNPKIKRKF